MIAGASVDRHHWVPKSEGGRETDCIHVVCHRMIHRVFDERALATDYADPEAVRAHPEIARFVTWVRRKPADYVDWPKEPRAGKRR
ncbi:HNH endonuclease [Pelagibius sp. 7325]|uniref:HNH endonuclease n=1 Tax=Pelagibius sp. 7325 TaxID=3131994 RepID=UPI0030EE2B8F